MLAHNSARYVSATNPEKSYSRLTNRNALDQGRWQWEWRYHERGKLNWPSKSTINSSHLFISRRGWSAPILIPWRTMHGIYSSIRAGTIDTWSQAAMGRQYCGPNVAEHFTWILQEEQLKIRTVLANPKAMLMTKVWQDYSTATSSHVGIKAFGALAFLTTPVSHQTYWEAAHNSSNLQNIINRETKTIPVVF